MLIHKGCGGQITTKEVAGEVMHLCDTCMMAVDKKNIRVEEGIFDNIADSDFKLKPDDTDRSIRG